MCGVLGLYTTTKAKEVPLTVGQSLLQLLVHRGQDASGICWIDEYSVHQMQKNRGPPKGIDLPDETSRVFIGSTRYPTLGVRQGEINLRKFAQPFSFQTNQGMLSIAHNGNITNMHEISTTPNAYDSDSEFITQRLGKHINQTRSLEEGLKALVAELDGSYSLVGMFGNNIFSFRDPRGIRPLVYGFNGEHYVFSSESIVLQQAGVDEVNDVLPGQLIVVEDDTLRRTQLVDQENIAHCYFEYVYFANSVSTINQKNVYRTRLKLGEVLAEQIMEQDFSSDIDYIVPVPDTSKAACETISEAVGAPMREAIMKNRSSLRTFIMPTVEQRHQAAKGKYLFVDDFIRGKNILLVDDSIVRGFTMKFLIEILRGKGANQIHVAITCPPQKYACYYGVDFGTDKELIAHRSTIPEIREEIGADSLTYLTVENMYRAIEIDTLCDACLTGNYPTEHGQLIRLKIAEGIIDEDSDTHYEKSVNKTS